MNTLHRFPKYLYGCIVLLILSIYTTLACAQTTPAAGAPAPPAGNEGRWVDNTSGPFYTGTADVDPGGSYYVEPYYFNYRTKGQNNIYVPTKFAYGLGRGLELDLYAPFDYNQIRGSDGNVQSALGYGDTLIQVKWQFAKVKDRYRFWAKPSMAFAFDLNVPTGKYKGLNPNLSGASQTSNGTWNEQIGFLIRKQFKPFELYLQQTELIQNPANVVGPYQFNNGIDSVPAGEHLRMIDGNVLETAGAIEHVLLPKEGFGYLVEYSGERQFGRSLLFGKANAPSFAYFDLSPELEVTWPSKGKYPITWAAGTTFTAARSNYPRQLTPIFTVSFYGDLHGSR
ncbi:MAG: hypothetical protein ACYDC6_07615 [Acidobacteriaceae bacterium]|jgi:hypothetical protein